MNTPEPNINNQPPTGYIRGAIIGSLISIATASIAAAIPVILFRVRLDESYFLSAIPCSPLLILAMMTGIMSYQYTKARIATMRAGNELVGMKFKIAYMLGVISIIIGILTISLYAELFHCIFWFTIDLLSH